MERKLPVAAGGPPSPWPVHAAEQLSVQAFASIIARAPELIVFGSGPVMRFPSAEVQSHLLGQGIGLEVMTTASACRTYNLLAQDGRRVAACLILPV